MDHPPFGERHVGCRSAAKVYEKRSGGLVLRRERGFGGAPPGKVRVGYLQLGARCRRARVVDARRLQAARYRGLKGVVTNADVPGRFLKDVCKLTDGAHADLRRQVERLNLSARAYDRILRVARTAADLKGRDAVTGEEVLEAAGYRALDGQNGFWA